MLAMLAASGVGLYLGVVIFNLSVGVEVGFRVVSHVECDRYIELREVMADRANVMLSPEFCGEAILG